MERPVFTNNKIYHVLNRGVEKRNIFIDNHDYLRFIHCLFEFNDINPANNAFYHFHKLTNEVEPRYIGKEQKPRKLLVKILAFCLMPNHFHLLLQQIRDGGIVKFMQKLGTGYTMYFNKLRERVGPLFQGKFKAVLVDEEAHFLHLPYYIHLNPLDLKFPEWRNYGGSTSLDWKGATKFLEKYRWSSYLDYIGKKNFPSVTQREFLTEFFGGPEQYKKDTIKWLKDLSTSDVLKLEEIKDLTLE